MVRLRCCTRHVKAISLDMVRYFDNRSVETDDTQRSDLPSTSTTDHDVCCAYSLDRVDKSTAATDNDREPDTSLGSASVTVNEVLDYTKCALTDDHKVAVWRLSCRCHVRPTKDKRLQFIIA
jgi:hypothetical protein